MHVAEKLFQQETLPGPASVDDFAVPKLAAELFVHDPPAAGCLSFANGAYVGGVRSRGCCAFTRRLGVGSYLKDETSL